MLGLGLAAAALLVWGARDEGRVLVLIIASVLVGTPLLIALLLSGSHQRVMPLIYPAMGQLDAANSPMVRYAFSDSLTREAALSLVANNYARLDTLLRQTPAPDLTAHDERGQSLLGIATRVAVIDGGTMRDVDGLRALIAAGAQLRADDLGRQETVMEVITRTGGERGRVVLELMLGLGLSADAPMADGRSVLFNDGLTPEAARILIARGAKTDVREGHGEAGEWSPVTYHAEQRRWETALALLNGGVPRDHSIPAGSALAHVMRVGDTQITNAERRNAAYKAFVAATR